MEIVKDLKENQGKKTIKDFPGSEIKVVSGRYGPYITDGKKNAKIPKDTTPEDLELSVCEELIKNAPEKKKRFFRRKKKSE